MTTTTPIPVNDLSGDQDTASPASRHIRSSDGPSVAEYRVSCERGPSSLLDRYAAEWHALCAEGPCDEPFYRPEWVAAYMASFDPGASVTLLTVRRAGAMRGILVLTERSIGKGPFRLRWLRTAANSHFPRFDVIHGTNDAHLVTTALWDFLRRWPEWDMLQFESAPGGGPAWSLLELARADGRATRFHRPDASPYIDLTRFPVGVDAVITSLPAKLRSQNRRSLKRLRALGEVEFRIVDSNTSEAQRNEAIESFYQMESSGWKGRAHSAIVSDPRSRHFYDRVIADAVTNHSFAIRQLWCQDKLVTAKLSLIWNQTMYDLKSGYDENYSKCSPGHLIKAYSVDAARSSGLTILDNCGRSDPDKVAWTSMARPFATCFIGNRTIRGRLAWSLLFRLGPTVRGRLQNIKLPGAIKSILD